MSNSNKYREGVPDIDELSPYFNLESHYTIRVRLRNDKPIHYGMFGQHISGYLESVNLDVRFISENGYKATKDIMDTISKEKNAKNYLREVVFLDYDTTLTVHLIFLKNHLLPIDKFFQLHKKSFQHGEQYNYFEKMLVGIQYLHSIGFIHGRLNPYSFFVSCNEKDETKVCDILISDIDLFTRMDNKGFAESFKKLDSSLRKIYEYRLQNGLKNTAFCALKQHTGGKISLKNNIESWFYLCIYLNENIQEWNEFKDDDDKMFIMKQNMRQPSYSGYKNISTRFTEILYFIDKMNDDAPDYDFIKKKIKSSLRHLDNLGNNLNTDDFTDPTDYLYIANDFRRRRMNFDDSEINLLRTEIAKAEEKDLAKLSNEQKSKENLKNKSGPSVACLPAASTSPNVSKAKIKKIEKIEKIEKKSNTLEFNNNVQKKKDTKFISSVKKKLEKMFRKS